MNKQHKQRRQTITRICFFFSTLSWLWCFIRKMIKKNIDYVQCTIGDCKLVKKIRNFGLNKTTTTERERVWFCCFCFCFCFFQNLEPLKPQKEAKRTKKKKKFWPSSSHVQFNFFFFLESRLSLLLWFCFSDHRLSLNGH